MRRSVVWARAFSSSVNQGNRVKRGGASFLLQKSCCFSALPSISIGAIQRRRHQQVVVTAFVAQPSYPCCCNMDDRPHHIGQCPMHRSQCEGSDLDRITHCWWLTDRLCRGSRLLHQGYKTEPKRFCRLCSSDQRNMSVQTDVQTEVQTEPQTEK